MKYLKLIYNPSSGNGLFKNNIDLIIDKFQNGGYQIIPYRLRGKDDVKNAFTNNDLVYEGVISAGGDGTLHDVINQMQFQNIKLPLGILPCGTSNDFASFLGIPKDLNKAINIILKKDIKFVDIGKINDRHFINVVAGGLLPSIAHKADKKLKNSMGMFAYYLKGLEEIKNLKPFDIRIKIDDEELNQEVLMFVILNTSIAGGFKVIPEAKIDDGIFDVCLIKNCTTSEVGALFIKLLKGEHINDSNIIYKKAKKITIFSNSKVETDIDGEKGLRFPLEIEAIEKTLRVYK